MNDGNAMGQVIQIDEAQIRSHLRVIFYSPNDGHKNAGA